MALTYAQHRNRVRMLTGNRLDDARAGDIINMILERLWAYSWSFRKKSAVLITVAPYADGTVTLNGDPTKVDGTGTAWDSTFIGRYFRATLDVGFYKITDVSGQQLTLEAAYAGAAFTDVSYEIFQHIYSLASDVDVAQSLGYWRKLSESTIESADRFDARRSFKSSFPWSFVYRGNDSSGNVQVEIQPVPSGPIPIRYNYITKAPILIPGTDDGIFLPIEADVLDYFSASEGLEVYCAEHPEISGVQILLNLAERHRGKGVSALQEALYADLKKAGAAQGVHDIDEDTYLGDEFAWDHDQGF